MSLAPGSLDAGLSALFDRLSGVPGSDPENRSGGYCDDATQAQVTFRLTSIAGVAQDELRVEYDPDAVIEGDTYEPNPGNPSERLGGVIYTSSGHRVLTYTVKVECHFQDVTAKLYSERIRTRLRLPSAQRELRALGLSIVSIGLTRDFSGSSFANREISTALFELVLNAVDAASDEAVTTIERAEATITGLEP